MYIFCRSIICWKRSTALSTAAYNIWLRETRCAIQAFKSAKLVTYFYKPDLWENPTAESQKGSNIESWGPRNLKSMQNDILIRQVGLNHILYRSYGMNSRSTLHKYCGSQTICLLKQREHDSPVVCCFGHLLLHV